MLKKVNNRYDELKVTLFVLDGPLPPFVMEHMDEEVKNVLLDIHERAFQHRSSMQVNRAAKPDPSKPKPNEPSKPIVSPTKQANDAKIRGKALTPKIL